MNSGPQQRDLPTQDIDWSADSLLTPDNVLVQSGLNELELKSAELDLRLLTGTTLLLVSSLLPAQEIQDLMNQCELPLPHGVNSSEGRDPSVLCLAPAQWLLVSDFLKPDRLFEAVEPMTGNDQLTVIDYSAGRSVLRLKGNAAPWLLNKLGGLDFMACTSSGQHCVRTQLQHAPVTVHYHQPGGHSKSFVFDLIVDRSLSRYLWELLAASAPHAEELFQQFGTIK